jgi:Tol biopolymer transport system component
MDLSPGPNAPSGNPLKLIGSTRHQDQASFSPDGKKIAFYSDRSGSDEIWVSNADGSSPVQLTFLGRHCGAPRWSPDSRRIVFDFEGQGNNDIYVVDAEGGTPKRLTNAARDLLPSWSWNGKWIYFASYRSGRSEIWRMSPEGGGIAELTHQGGGSSPQESPDGKAVYYLHGGKVWSIPAEGGAESQVVESPKVQRWGAWQPFNDGLYFMEPVVGTPNSTESRIQFFEFASRKITSLGHLEKPSSLEGFSVSPDRDHVIFGQIDQNAVDIMLVENFR